MVHVAFASSLSDTMILHTFPFHLPLLRVTVAMCLLALIDADSTSIKITVKDGGMKLLQIQDNGCGIRVSDTTCRLQRAYTLTTRAERGPPYSRGEIHDVKDLDVPRSGKARHLRVPRRSSCFHILRISSVGDHKDETRRVCMEVRRRAQEGRSMR